MQQWDIVRIGLLSSVELNYFATDNQLVIESGLILSPFVIPDQILTESNTNMGLMSWCVFLDVRTGLPSLSDPRLEFPLFYPLVESSSLDPLWSFLYSTLYWSLLHLTLSGVFFARPSTGVFFTQLPLESPLFDPFLESSSLHLLWSLLYSTLYWSLLHLTLPGVSFTLPSTGVFFTWLSLESLLLHPLLETSSLSMSLVCGPSHLSHIGLYDVISS
jgi:hypothetical protein